MHKNQANRPVLRQLVSLMRPFSGRMLLALVLSTLTIGSSVALMMTSAWLISTAGLQLGITSLGLAPTAVRMFGLSRALFRYLERLVSHDVTFSLLARLRVWFYERIEPLSPAQLHQYSSGDLMSRIVADIEELQNLYIRVVAPPLVAMMITIMIGVIFALIDPLVAIVAVGFMIISSSLLPLFTWWISRSIGRTLVEVRAKMNTHLVDSIQGLPDSIAYGYAQARSQQFENVNIKLTQFERRMAGLDAIQNGLSVLMVNLAAFSVLFSAIERVEGVLLASVTLGTIAAFEAITPLALATQNLGREMVAANRVFEIIDSTTSIREPDMPLIPPNKELDVAFRSVSFRYHPDNHFVFEKFSLNIAYGSHINITGESGSGKSSLVNMLLRFWDYEQGEIVLGGVDLRQIAHENLRQIFGVMTQRTHLFNTTIRENIRIAKKTATDDEIVQTAKMAQIHDFIMSLPQGYDTYVGENGMTISGGERQRIALARILLKDAPIWILDEIIANLDPITGNKVIESVLNTGKNRTIILLTHHSRRDLPTVHVS